ncbi:MAG: hypothetical protein JST80_09255 [Bdellovibrionales bacterium]|nr:hypothetical protein [Bdellovibrionales bacterium]
MDEPLDAEEWKTFELYEKIRVRKRRQKFWVSALVFCLFLVLCAVPVIEEQLPKWKSLELARRLAVEIEKMKTLSIQRKQPIRMTFLDNGEMRVEIVSKCQDPASAGTVIHQKQWIGEPEDLKVLHLMEAQAFELRMAMDQVCFDPVYGLDDIKSKRVVVIAPVKDLTKQRLDRASYVILEGESAKISIN